MADSASIFPCPAVSSRVVLTCRFLWDKIQWQIGLKWAMSVTWGRWIFQKMSTHFGRFRPSPTLFNVWCFGVAEALRFIAATSQHQSVWSHFWGSNSYIYSAKLSCDDRPWRPWRKDTMKWRCSIREWLVLCFTLTAVYVLFCVSICAKLGQYICQMRFLICCHSHSGSRKAHNCFARTSHRQLQCPCLAWKLLKDCSPDIISFSKKRLL